MLPFDTVEIPAARVKSLVWRHDLLVDWVGGNRVFRLDGTAEKSHVSWSYRFDAALQGPAGWSCIYERRGTKCLLLREGKLVREIERSFYCANAYDYPIAFVPFPGRLLLAHCPERYCQLDLDDVETGERLTRAKERKPDDFFHSRLAVSPGGTRIVSAGWVWHPIDMISIYDVAAALKNPCHLDGIQGTPRTRDVDFGEESSAAWRGNDTLLLGKSPFDRPERHALTVLDVSTSECGPEWPLDEPAGTLMPVGQFHAVRFYDHPRLIDLRTGVAVATWPTLATGRQASSIDDGDVTPLPPLALDPANRRFAVAGLTGITVVTFAAAEKSS